jgi:osmotically-inducible protein OsmY/sporulation protein YlmC with PRC-barrel domain
MRGVLLRNSIGLAGALALVGSAALGGAYAQQPQQGAGPQMPQHGKTGDQARGQQPTDQQALQDRALADRAYSRLAEQARGYIADVEIAAARNGEITLGGLVPDEQARQDALKIVRETQGVKNVVDQLKVDEKAMTGAQADRLAGEELARRVAQTLATGTLEEGWARRDPSGQGWDIVGPGERWRLKVRAEQQTIILDGNAPSTVPASEITAAAEKVPGVQSVRGQLSAGAGPEPRVATQDGGREPQTRLEAQPRPGQPATPPAAAPGTAGTAGSIQGHEFKGVNTVTGEVTSVDRQSGLVTVDTDQGTMEVHFPPAALQSLERGDRITVGMGFTKTAAEAPATRPAPGASGQGQPPAERQAQAPPPRQQIQAQPPDQQHERSAQRPDAPPQQAARAGQEPAGQRTITGEVVSVDQPKGKLTLKTGERTLDLRLPPSALQNVSRGDRLTLEVAALDRAAGARPGETAGQQQARRTDDREPERPTWSKQEGLYESSRLIGARVKNAQGKDIGEIDQLIVDPKDGRITHAVLGVGGLLGIGEKKLVVPWSEIRVAHEGQRTPKVTIDEGTLGKAPRYAERPADARDTGSARPATGTTDAGKVEPEKKDEPKR